MDQLINTFHLDFKLIIAQVINFVLVLLILSFGLKPLLKIMNERTNKIEKSLKDAEKIDKKLISVNEEKKQIIQEAKTEANNILNETKILAEKNRDNILAKTKEDVNEVVQKGKNQLREEKENMLNEAKDEISNLVILAVKKIVGESMDKNFNKKLVNKVLDDINKK